MPEPWELSDEQIVAERELLRPELEAADREAAPFLLKSLAKSIAVHSPDSEGGHTVADFTWLPPETAHDLSASPAAAGGIEAEERFPLDPKGYVHWKVFWDEKKIEINWEFGDGADPSLEAILTFFDRTTGKPFGEPRSVGNLDTIRKWTAEARDLGFSPMTHWGVTLLFIET
jgi:hypothetical protein